MKLRVTVVQRINASQPQARDATVTTDVTATVGEIARALVRAGAGDPRLLPYATHREAPLTLRAEFPDKPTLILDAGDPIGTSGLSSGSSVEPVLEAAPGEGRRSRTPIAQLTVLDGAQAGVSFLAVQGENLIGRERGSRVELHDRSVSRRHAVLALRDGHVVLEDLGSANGIARIDQTGRAEPAHSIHLTGTSTVEIGAVRARIEVGPPAQRDQSLASSIPHLQSPHVDPVFTPDPIELPSPPDTPEPTRFPLIAMVAPLLMGAVLYLTTQSMMSLIFIALSPLIMIGSWVDTRLTRRKTTATKQREYVAGMALARTELTENRDTELLARNAETPHPADLLRYPTDQDLRLWTRRPEHRAFLELRLGKAQLPSRKRIELPTRGKIPAENWAELSQLHEEFATVPDVPVLERLDRCGSLGVAGPALWASAAARALLVQLFALHSPADLVFTAFACADQADGDWAWLKWVPHADSAYSPLGVSHLVSDPRSANSLLTALEGLIQTRSDSARAGTIRSRIEGSAADAGERLAPASDLAPAPAIVVLVLSDVIVDRTRLVGLAEDGADVGVHLIWLASHLGATPAACRTVIEVTEGAWRAHFVRQGEIVPLSGLDFIDTPQAHTFGRALAPVVDAGARVLDESDFPRSVALGQIVDTDILGSGEAVAQAWHANDSLTSGWSIGVEREPGPLSAVVGQGSDGPVELDLRTHGPHALVGGTTGSGKSEFLQTWILSLAAQYAPDRLTFLLVDYKGGAAFADCVDLPHTVGLVTDLNTHLVRRALTSLRAELRYREELLAEKGAKDLIALERRGDPDAPPTLVIVIDEFAALVNEIPEFVDGVIDVAQRGRSLGLHLVMATQRPAGVIKDNLRANTNLRIGLRMSDPADSTDVLGVADAAGFAAETPGRAAVKIGAGRLTHFQTGYLGGRSETEQRDAVEIRDLTFGEHAPWPLHPEVRQRGTERSRKGPRDIEVLAQNIRDAAQASAVRAPRRPWVDQLPSTLLLDQLQDFGAPRSRAAAGGCAVSVGLVDEPSLQRQSPYRIHLTEIGNVAIYGGSGSGKTTALISFAVAAIREHPAAQVFGIDSAGGRLSLLTQLPNTGDVVPADDKDRTTRLLGMLTRVVATRGSSPAGDRPPVLLLVDGFAAFRDAYEHLGGGTNSFQYLVEVARAGRNVGVHVVFASERAANFPAALAASIPERLSLKLTAESDYQLLGIPASALEDAPPGRAVRIGSDEEIHIAVPAVGNDPSDLDAAIAALAGTQREAGVAQVPGVPGVPTHVSRTALSEAGSPAAFAIETADLQPVDVPEGGMLLVTGPAGSGRTTAVTSLIDAISERVQNQNERLDAVLLSPRRSSLRALHYWTEIADNSSSREHEIERLTLALGGKPHAAAGLTLLPLIGSMPIEDAPEQDEIGPAPSPFPAPGARGLVVIEDIGGFDGSGNEAALAALLKLLRRSDHTVIIEGENATLSTVWELAAPLRGARWAIALQPDANDTPSLFTTPFTHEKRANYPPGRGLLVRNGTLTGIHVAEAETLGAGVTVG